ncbi:MAG TPA: hypothetical protein VFJ85_01990 [Acidimicrobiales bacterium]|nr:hypothetical protein [Acidimicrobiales bacterium]
MLHLQRAAGNAGVAQLLRPAVQRCGQTPCACPPEKQAEASAHHHGPVAQRTEEGGDSDFVEEDVPADPIVVSGQPGEVEHEGGCSNLALHGKTTANFDGGPNATVTNQKITTSKGCAGGCPAGTPCVHATGTLESTYSAAVTIAMPSMPSGLTECEQGKVQDFLDNVLAPHEKDHETRLKTYDGTTKIPVDITACGMDAVTKKVEKIHLDEEAKRQDAARKSSKQIDPFTKTVDCTDCA